MSAAPHPTPPARLRRLGAEAAYLGLGLLTGTLAFAVWMTGVTVSLSLAVLIVGLPAVLATFAGFRWRADLERKRAALVLAAPIASAYRGGGGSFGQRLLASLTDPQSWKDLAHLGIFGIVGFTGARSDSRSGAAPSAASRSPRGGGRYPTTPGTWGFRSTPRPSSSPRSSG